MKKRLAIIYDERCLLHSPSFEHPERPERVKAILDKIQAESFLTEADMYPAIEAPDTQILAAHTKEHFDYVKNSIESGRPMLDSDTYIVKDSWLAAKLAAGAAIQAVDFVMDDLHQRIFVLMRPPGHHATKNEPMGFCLFNNIAIGAQYAIDKYRLERIAIVDWDVHHGNGTQDIFYSSDKVLFVSTHQHPFYPGTGAESETGDGKGKGFTINFPLPAGTDGRTYTDIFENKIIKYLEHFDPQLLFISAGFDAHKDDTLANMNLIEKDFAKMTSILDTFAKTKNIKIISLLEGGYNLKALAGSVFAHLKLLNES